MGVPGNAGTAGGWVFGAGKCRKIAIWVPAIVGQGSAGGSIFSAEKCPGKHFQC